MVQPTGLPQQPGGNKKLQKPPTSIKDLPPEVISDYINAKMSSRKDASAADSKGESSLGAGASMFD